MVGLYDLCSSKGMEDIVLGRLVELVLNGSGGEDLRRLLSTDDEEYIEDVRVHLLDPMGQVLRGMLGRSSEEIRGRLREMDLGWGNGRRLTDRMQYLVQSLIHREFGEEIQERQILEGHPYLLCMDHIDGGYRNELVRAYSSSIVYRLSATRMKNNHGSDSVAMMCLRNGKGSGEVLDREAYPYRIVYCEYKTGDGRHRLPFFKSGTGSSFGAASFGSYADELSNVARQINARLRRAGIDRQLDTITMYQADPVNWDHRQVLDLSDEDYRRVLGILRRDFLQVDGETLKLGEKLEYILKGYPSVRRDIIQRILLPYMSIRDALADAATVEEFHATGKHFRFHPTKIGYKGKRDGHIQLKTINPDSPPKLGVRNGAIVLHPEARWFRLKGGRVVFGFDMDDNSPSPFLLQEEEIRRIVRRRLIPYLNRLWNVTRKLRQRGWRNLPMDGEEQEEILRFLETDDKMGFLLQVKEGHIINFFRQEVQKRLFSGNLSSLQINGNRYCLFKVINAWGSQKFREQLQILCDTYAQYPYRYDQVVLTLRERLHYRSSGNRTSKKRKSRTVMKRQGIPISQEQVIHFIAGKVRMQLEDDGKMVVVPPFGFPFTGPFFERHDLTRADHLKDVVQALLRSENLSFTQGPGFLRFPIDFSGEKPSFGLKLTKKPSWDELDRCVKLKKKDSRFIQNLNRALQANLNDPYHFQAIVEFARLGIAKTQLSSVYGILDEWLDSSSREEIDRIAFQTANAWDTMDVYSFAGQRSKPVKLGTIVREGRKVKINGRNRIIWFLEGVHGGEEEPNVQFNKDYASIAAEFLSLSEKVKGNKQVKLSQIDWLCRRNLEPALLIDLFTRQHMVEDETHQDIVQILLHRTKVRYQRKGYAMRPILHTEEKQYRQNQLNRLATFFTPSNVFFSASGRAIAAEVNLRRDAAVSLHQTRIGFPLVNLIKQMA